MAGDTEREGSGLTPCAICKARLAECDYVIVGAVSMHLRNNTRSATIRQCRLWDGMLRAGSARIDAKDAIAILWATSRANSVRLCATR